MNATMTSTMLQQRAPAVAVGRQSSALAVRPVSVSTRKRFAAARASTENDSYQKLEAPVRTEFPAGVQVGPDVKDRQSEADDIFKSDALNPDRQILGTDVGFLEMMRFKGALPEILNSRLAMLGFVLAVLGERVQHKDLFEQVASQPNIIAAVIALITVASAIPFYRGVRRSGNPIFTADAELWNGRLAMMAMVLAVVNTAVRGHIF